jgi:hypothetical protein
LPHRRRASLDFGSMQRTMSVTMVTPTDHLDAGDAPPANHDADMAVLRPAGMTGTPRSPAVTLGIRWLRLPFIRQCLARPRTATVRHAYCSPGLHPSAPRGREEPGPSSMLRARGQPCPRGPRQSSWPGSGCGSVRRAARRASRYAKGYEVEEAVARGAAPRISCRATGVTSAWAAVPSCVAARSELALRGRFCRILARRSAGTGPALLGA